MLLSDGASRLVDLFDLATWEELLALLAENDPDELLRQVRMAEAADAARLTAYHGLVRPGRRSGQ